MDFKQELKRLKEEYYKDPAAFLERQEYEEKVLKYIHLPDGEVDPNHIPLLIVGRKFGFPFVLTMVRRQRLSEIPKVGIVTSENDPFEFEEESLQKKAQEIWDVFAKNDEESKEAIEVFNTSKFELHPSENKAIVGDRTITYDVAIVPENLVDPASIKNVTNVYARKRISHSDYLDIMMKLNIGPRKRPTGINYLNRRYLGRALALIYWHFVDIIWIFLFITVYVYQNLTLN